MDVAVAEFPFVQDMPKREVSKLRQVWDLVCHLDEAQKTKGTLLPLMMAAKALDVSRTRVDQLVADGRLERVTVDGHVFLTLDTVTAYAASERKGGRPLKNLDSPPTLRELTRMAKELQGEATEKK